MDPLRSSLIAFAAAAATSVVAISASAQISQPDGTLVPDQNTSGDYFDTSRYNVNTLGLGTMLNALENGLVDYRADAAIEPSTFSPLCGLQGSMILRGGSCNMDFGWYCVDHVPTSNTDPNFVPLVTATDVRSYHDALTGTYEQYKNDDKGFVPLIGMPPVQGAPLEGVQEHPVFQNCPSQQIGFALMPTGIAISSVGSAVCNQPKFSQAQLNTTHAGSGQPWISALVYASQTSPGVFYIAFEDLPSSPSSFVDYSVVPSTWGQDSDFNDFVYMVEGIQCKGGGQICDTGAPGKCGIGVTECTIDGAAGACTPRFGPEQEECNNIDDDCDGLIDGDGLCPAEAPRCFEGECVANCGGGEFPCPAGYVCDDATSLCVVASCLGVVCGPEQVCKDGLGCVGGCEGVTCPTGQDCISGQCIDLCQGQACPDGFVCTKGACIADCHCLACPNATDTCSPDGRCIDTACDSVVCADGLICRAGVCVDACDGVTCPGGQICVAGGCQDAVGPGTGGGGSTIDGTGGGFIGALGGTDTGGSGTNPGNPPVAPVSESGCGCRTASRGPVGAAGAASLLLLGLAFARRRRRRPVA